MRKIPFGKPIIGDRERKAVAEVLEGTMFVHGPKAKAFEAAFADFTQAPRALSVASCTAGLHLAWFDQGIGPSDEVVVPAQSHVATAHSIEYTGASCVFVDAEIETGNMDLNQLEAAITPNTKGIALVHYLGMPVDMDRVMAVAKKHGLFVLEDCALSIGATYKGIHTGLIGDAGCFSFYPVKHMTTAEGGMFITKHEELADRIEKKKAFGVDRVVGERKVPGVYDVNMLGYNYRMNEIEAALGIEQVGRMEGFLEKRRENYEALETGLAEIDELKLFQSTHGVFKSSYYCLSALLTGKLVEKRFDIVKKLNEKGVGTSIYYPKPIPHMSYYKDKYGHGEDSFPNAARISYNSIALPVGPHLDVEDMAYIVDSIKTAINEV